ncbi:hypothetical protein [Streptomyces sp. Pv4-95]|uniref:hypothetical protein n=1 Tax=Streptomyces sp. Pv4-95 TaxID=3049543 RepID=UPI003892A0E9
MADLVFQAADLLTQRRLRDAQACGGMAESWVPVEFLGWQDEVGVQLLDGKFRALHTRRDIRPCLKFC